MPKSPGFYRWHEFDCHPGIFDVIIARASRSNCHFPGPGSWVPTSSQQRSARQGIFGRPEIDVFMPFTLPVINQAALNSMPATESPVVPTPVYHCRMSLTLTVYLIIRKIYFCELSVNKMYFWVYENETETATFGLRLD